MTLYAILVYYFLSDGRSRTMSVSILYRPTLWCIVTAPPARLYGNKTSDQQFTTYMYFMYITSHKKVMKYIL